MPRAPALLIARGAWGRAGERAPRAVQQPLSWTVDTSRICGGHGGPLPCFAWDQEGWSKQRAEPDTVSTALWGRGCSQGCPLPRGFLMLQPMLSDSTCMCANCRCARVCIACVHVWECAAGESLG